MNVKLFIQHLIMELLLNEISTRGIFLCFRFLKAILKIYSKQEAHMDHIAHMRTMQFKSINTFIICPPMLSLDTVDFTECDP